MTTSIVRPDSIVSGGSNFTATGAASLNAATSDDSDSSWIRKTGNGTSSTILGFGTVSLTSTQTIKQVRLRARVSTPTSSGKMNIQLGTRVSGTNYFFPALTVRGTSAISTKTGAWQTSAPDGGTWTQSKIDALRVQVTDYRDSSDRGYVYELFIDVDVVSQPTVTVTAPSGTISTTAKPDVTWTYSDTDGDGQTYYSLKVFTSAQYSDPAFDPVDSTAVFDSGIVASSDSTAAVGDYLINGAHRAYVRVAKTINGSPFWSAWAYSAFTVSLTPPSTPTVTTSYSSGSNRVTVTIDGVASGTFDYQVFTLERSDDGGTTWATVRNAAEIVPGLGFDATVYDYEAPRGITAKYRARAVGVLGENVVASDWSTVSNVSVTNDQLWWIKAVSAPTLNTGNVRILAGVGISVEEDLGVFRPIGRSKALVVSGTIYGKDGSYRIATTSDAEWSSIYALATHQGTLLVQDPYGGQKYVRAISRNWEETGAISALRRDLTLGYVEVDA